MPHLQPACQNMLVNFELYLKEKNDVTAVRHFLTVCQHLAHNSQINRASLAEA